MTYSKILGTGSYLPETKLSNADFEKYVETSDEWIVTRTGIKSRHLIRNPYEPGDELDSVTSMGKAASLKAIEAAGIDKNDIDMIIVATTSADLQFPSAACQLQAALDVAKTAVPSFDITAVCSGFVYALSVADKFIKAGGCKNVLVVGSEALSRIVDWQDRATCVLFGDGAGAVVLGASEEPGIISTHIHADGRYKDFLWMDCPFSKEPSYIRMQGKETFKIAVNTLGSMFEETLDRAGYKHSDVDWLIPHQANLRIIQAMAKKLDMTMDRVALTIDSHANTSAASIPLALDKVVRDGGVQRGHKLLLEAFGGGLTWGSVLLDY